MAATPPVVCSGCTWGRVPGGRGRPVEVVLKDARLGAASALPAEYPGWMVDWQIRGRRPVTVV